MFPRRRGGHKFGAVPTVYGGQRYPSKAEAAFAQQLDWRQAAGEVVTWTRGTPLVLVDAPRARGRVTYLPDFEVTPAGGNTYLVDVKGVETPVWRLKMKLLRARYPALQLLVVSKEGERWLP
jgi:hypothetical protein